MTSKQRSRGNKDMDEELDFDEEFQDDDGMLELGIDDEEELKEASRRTLGKATKKANFEDLDEEIFEEKRGLKSREGKVCCF